VLAALVSAYVHLALTPEHMKEMPALGIAFIVSVVLSLAVGFSVVLKPDAKWPAQAAALLFSGLVFAYVASRTTGLPLLEPVPEPLDLVGVLTVAAELAGLAAALWITRPEPTRTREKNFSVGSR